MEFDFSWLHFVSSELSNLHIFAQNDPTEITPEMKKMIMDNMDVAAKAVREKTGQTMALIAIPAIPVGLFLLWFIVNIIYKTFTGVADKTAEKLETPLDKAQLGLLKLKRKVKEKITGKEYKPEFEYDDDDDETAEEAEEKKPVEVPKFGDILRKFVLQQVTEDDIDKALAYQETNPNGKKIGEILSDSGIISRIEIDQTLKIQEKRRTG